MDLYLANNYSKCFFENVSYLATKEYMTIAVRIISILAFPIWVLGVYLVVKATPKAFSNTKNVMLHSHFCTLLLDLVISVLVIPFLILPSCAINTTGLFSKIGVPFKVSIYVGQLSIACVGVSYSMLFENRHHSVTMIRFKLNLPIHRYIFFGLLHTICALAFVSYYFEDINNDEAKLEILKSIPCPQLEFFNAETQVVVTDVRPTAYICLFLLFLVESTVIFFVVHATYHLAFTSDKNVSKKTRELQRKFLKNIFIQAMIPTVAVAIPAIWCFANMAFGNYNQAVNNHIVIGMAMHSLVANVTLCLIHKPYRDETFRLLLCRRGSEQGFPTIMGRMTSRTSALQTPPNEFTSRRK